MQVNRQQKYIHKLSTSFFENTKAHGDVQNEKGNQKMTTTSQFLKSKIGVLKAA